MFKMKEWFSKYGVVAPISVAALATMLVAAIAMSVGTNDGTSAMAERVGDTLFGTVPQLSPAELAELKKAEDARRATWMVVVPKLKAAEVRRAEIAAKCQQEVDKLIAEICESVSGGAFADAVCSWESTWQMVYGSDAHNAWVMSQFRNLVFDDATIADRLQERLELARRELIQLDSELLIDLQADVPLSLDSLAVSDVSFAGTDSIFRPVVENSGTYLGQAWGEFAIAEIAGGAAGGMVALGIQALNAADDGAATTPEAAIFTLVSSIAAEVVASEIVERTISSRGELATLVQNRVRTFVSQFQSQHPESAVWMQPLWNMVRAHETTMAETLIQALPVDRDWAMNALKTIETSTSAPIDGGAL